ncbi:MAG: glycosyltransferase family protein [Planctomycetota bacterium]
MVGLGHMRRNLRLARALTRSELDPVILLLAEARETCALTIAENLDCLSLPAIRKDEFGIRAPRQLPVDLDELVRVRASVLSAALAAFDPDVLLVDHLPLGAADELLPALEERARSGHTLCVLGLRDILDAPDVVARNWKAKGSSALRRYYDAVWVYGDRSVYDPIEEYSFAPDIAAKFRFVGYVCPRPPPRETSPFGEQDSDRSVGLCQVGGGQDGAALARAFVRAPLPPGVRGMIVSGPFMPRSERRELHRIAATRPDIEVVDFLPATTPLLERAAFVVCMGGYNTVCETLGHDVPTLVVPRTKPGREQLIRAERLRRLGLLDFMLPDQVTPASLAEWMANVRPSPISAWERIDMGGLDRIPAFFEDLLARGTRARKEDHVHA